MTTKEQFAERLKEHIAGCSLCSCNPFGLCAVGYSLLAALEPENGEICFVDPKIMAKPFVKTFVLDRERRANAKS